ncbi:hypothetical protein Tco_1121737 [Tanacetum coccineum]|uniref:Reverse transcriptase domain-containing protein n=1 Tax=Tanacetum coccineum TaxID=301880 RepID=A0ABQ5IYI9_9ASTR
MGGRKEENYGRICRFIRGLLINMLGIIMVDMNATMASRNILRNSSMNTDMNEFKGCVNRIEVDRYFMKLKKKAFKFANFVAENEEFLNIIRKAWDNQFKGRHMFKTVKKFKSLKAELKKLAWKDGNIFDKVQELKLQLKDLQTKIDDDPYSKELRVKESKCIHEYVEAMKDEEKLLYQKAKIKWLKGNYLFQGEEVAEQFVNHFKIFLGVEVPVNDVGQYLPLIKKKLSSNDAYLMDRNQSAFVPDRHIQDNILLSQELFKGYDRKEGPKRVAMKIDIQKAYDTVNWKLFSQIEKLPIRYLGVPLASKRISAKNCKSLIDKIKNKVCNDKSKCLSYAERLLLIASVLESIHVYWASVFLFPKPKSKGGLGLKDLGVWNKAMIVKHLWYIINNKETLWVKWINTVKLKGRSVWAANEEKYNDELVL